MLFCSGSELPIAGVNSPSLVCASMHVPSCFSCRHLSTHSGPLLGVGTYRRIGSILSSEQKQDDQAPRSRAEDGSHEQRYTWFGSQG